MAILALLKFSTSPISFGSSHTSINLSSEIGVSIIVSFNRKYGKNFILS